jgi:cobalt-zinc-cadmium efflux system outer membrane protein
MNHVVRTLTLACVIGAGGWSAARAQPTVPSFSLRDALAQARALSPARQASVARVDAADLSRQWAGRLPNPAAEVRWENWASGRRDVLPLDMFATVTQPIELGGKRAARVGVAAAAADSARAALGTTERELDGEVVQRYLAVVRERDRGRLLAEQAQGLSELVRILERRVAEGVTAEADLRKLETEWARVDTDAALARIRASRELAPLAALVGWTPLPPVDALERPAVRAALATDVNARITAAFDRRHDVRLANARLQAARQTLRFEQARGVPDLNVTGGLKRTSGYDTGVVGVSVAVPFFERNRGAQALARGNVTAAELELEQARRRADGEARAALTAAEELASRHADAEARLVAPATVVRTAARSAFESGAGDLLRLVDAERVYADTRTAVNELSLDAVLASIEVRLALAEDVLP